MSLGADSRQVQRMVLMEGAVLLGVRPCAGLCGGGTFSTTRLIRGLLFGVAPHDPVTYLVGA